MYTCYPSGKPFPPTGQPYWPTGWRQHPLGSLFVGLGRQKRSLAAGASAVDPVFSWFSPSPPLNGLFAFVFLSSPFSSEHPCYTTSCNFPPLVHPPPHGGLIIGGLGNGAPPPSKSSPYAIIYSPRAETKHTSKVYDAAPLNDRLEELIRAVILLLIRYGRFAKLGPLQGFNFFTSIH